MSEKKQPNFLILFTDQQRYDTINACGYPYMNTPNLDRLVREGVSFDQAYTPNPVCVPARHNLLTGLPARFHGYFSNARHPLNFRLPTLPRIFSDNGYDTRAIGKMHFQPPRRHSGFAKMELMEEIPRFRQDDEYLMYLKENGYGNVQDIHGIRNLLYMTPQRALVPEKHHGSTWVADRTVEYLKTNGGKRPFFLWSSWIAPHPPFNVPEGYADMYKDADLPLPLKSETPIQEFHSSRPCCDIPEGKETEYLRRVREVYFSMVSHVDHNIGKILSALEEIGELDNTFILFTTDHGEMLGDHNCFQKMQPYDSCARIPYIIRYPELAEAGSVRHDFADLNDILPTLLDVAGLEYPEDTELPGASVFGDAKDRKYQYIEHHKNQRRWISLRNKSYKFNYYYGGAEEELFDMESDPEETVNLLYTSQDDPEIKTIRDELRRKLVEFEKKWGPEGYVENGDFISFPKEVFTGRPGRNGQFPVFPENIADQEEFAAINDFGDEVIEAVKDEPMVKLHELDLEGGRINGVPQELIDKIEREKL